jgi:hypothetical protein
MVLVAAAGVFVVANSARGLSWRYLRSVENGDANTSLLADDFTDETVAPYVVLDYEIQSVDSEILPEVRTLVTFQSEANTPLEKVVTFVISEGEIVEIY